MWGEREIRDMYGLIPVGLPDERRLVLPDDWPEEMYPLRKDAMDYRQRPAPATEVETYPFLNEGKARCTCCTNWSYALPQMNRDTSAYS